MSEVVTATWIAELNCDCPACKAYVNLLDDQYFFVGKDDLAVGEHATERSSNLPVKCPECGHEFIVCCEW